MRNEQIILGGMPAFWTVHEEGTVRETHIVHAWAHRLTGIISRTAWTGPYYLSLDFADFQDGREIRQELAYHQCASFDDGRRQLEAMIEQYMRTGRIAA